MRRHDRLAGLIELAEQEQRCVYADEPADLYAIRRRVREGTLVNPFRGMYAEAEYWHRLNPTEQAMHIIRTLARRKPHRVFAALSAAAVYDLEHPWSLHGNGMVVVATATPPAAAPEESLKKAGVTTILRTDYREVRRSSGLFAKLSRAGVPLVEARR